jgi:DUF1680 family protein
VPGWCRSASLTGPDGERTGPGATANGGTIRETRAWRPGDTVVLTLTMPVRLTAPDPRIDAVRGSLALERGPLVYCIESPDMPDAVEVEEVAIDATVEPSLERRPDIADPIVGLRLAAIRQPAPTPTEPWPYTDLTQDQAVDRPDPSTTAIEIRAIPYLAWANRPGRAMRVWIPTTDPDHPEVPDADAR